MSRFVHLEKLNIEFLDIVRVLGDKIRHNYFMHPQLQGLEHLVSRTGKNKAPRSKGNGVCRITRQLKT